MKFLTNQTNLFWASVLSILGFSVSCSSEEKYGVPTTIYKIKGKVISSENQQAIAGIQAVLQHQYLEDDTLLTNGKGGFMFSKWISVEPLDTFYVKLTDIDSTENGAFQNKEGYIIFDNPVFTGGDMRTAEKDLGKIELQPKQE